MTALRELFPGMRRIAGLAWPVLVAQLASIGMMVIDTVVVGQHSTADLAAVAIGSSLYVSLMLGMSGIIQALGPVVAHHYGAGRETAVGPSLQQGFWLAWLLSLPGCALLLFPGPVLELAGTPPEVAGRTAGYLQVLACCLPASLTFRAFHAAANALGKPRPLMVIGMLQTAGHAVLCGLLVGGAGSLPALGATGAAMSQAAMSWVACLSGFWLLQRSPFWQTYRPLHGWRWPVWRAQAELLRLGVPMGISYLVEITAFTFIALFIARLGPEVVGAHRIVVNISAVIYMLPLALATACSALVAQSAGGGREAEARYFVRAGITLAALLAALMALGVWGLREVLAGIGTRDAEVATLAASLVFYIALYQIPDGVQTVAGFVLRGYKVTFLPLLIHLLCFWGLGLGIGYWLAFLSPAPQGVAGFWQATVLSTLAACVLLGSLLLWVMARRKAATVE